MVHKTVILKPITLHISHGPVKYSQTADCKLECCQNLHTHRNDISSLEVNLFPKHKTFKITHTSTNVDETFQMCIYESRSMQYWLHANVTCALYLLCSQNYQIPLYFLLQFLPSQPPLELQQMEPGTLRWGYVKQKRPSYFNDVHFIWNYNSRWRFPL